MSYATTRSHLPAGAAATLRHVDTPAYETDWHAHDEYMFILPRTGDLAIAAEFAKTPVNVARAQFSLIAAGVFHTSKVSVPRQEHLAVYVDADFVRYCERRAGRTIAQGSVPVWTLTAPLRAALHARNALRQSTGRELSVCSVDLADRLLAAQCVEHSLYARGLDTAAPSSPAMQIARIQAFLEAHLDEKIDIDRIAAEFGMSRRHLTRVFKECTGATLVEFINRLRVRQARLLLEAPGATVLSVCLAVGLESPSYLAKLLARHDARYPPAPAD